jgi:hypothetical protein
LRQQQRLSDAVCKVLNKGARFIWQLANNERVETGKNASGFVIDALKVVENFSANDDSVVSQDLRTMDLVSSIRATLETCRGEFNKHH